MPRSGGEAAEMVGLLQCEPPNARLHSFEGRLSFHSLDGARPAAAPHAPVTSVRPPSGTVCHVAVADPL